MACLACFLPVLSPKSSSLGISEHHVMSVKVPKLVIWSVPWIVENDPDDGQLARCGMRSGIKRGEPAR